MNFLKKLGTPFVAIWRWIKETAWVQPLLIVGIIFAIIFSIPSITSGIQNLIDSMNDDISFYDDHELSMEGSEVGKWDSDADKFFENYAEAQDAWANDDKDTARSLLNGYSDGQNRFFLFFVQDDCSGCSNLRTGIEYLTDNWSTYITDSSIPSFKWQSIIVNREYDNDYYDDNEITPIGVTVTSPSYLTFYDNLMSFIPNSDYYLNLSFRGGDSDSSTRDTIYSNAENLSNPDKISTPFCVLFDLTDTNTTRNIITEAFCTAEGSTTYTYAEFIKNAWTYDGIFDPKYRS